MKREKIEEGKVIKKKVSLILLSHNSVSCHMREIHGPRSVLRSNTAQGHQSCTASTTCDSDPTRVRGDTVTPTLSKLRGVVESETLVKNVSIQQTP